MENSTRSETTGTNCLADRQSDNIDKVDARRAPVLPRQSTLADVNARLVQAAALSARLSHRIRAVCFWCGGLGGILCITAAIGYRTVSDGNGNFQHGAVFALGLCFLFMMLMGVRPVDRKLVRRTVYICVIVTLSGVGTFTADLFQPVPTWRKIASIPLVLNCCYAAATVAPLLRRNVVPRRALRGFWKAACCFT